MKVGLAVLKLKAIRAFVSGNDVACWIWGFRCVSEHACVCTCTCTCVLYGLSLCNRRSLKTLPQALHAIAVYIRTIDILVPRGYLLLYVTT